MNTASMSESAAASEAIPRLILIGPIANVNPPSEALKAILKQQQAVENEILSMLTERTGIKPYVGVYGSPPMEQTYGSVRHMRRLAQNMVVLANDLYLDLCSNKSRTSEIHIVSCESGAYMAFRVIELFDRYGDSLEHPKDFDKYWCKLLAGDPIEPDGTTNSNTEPRISDLFRTVVLIEPSLPAPGLFAKWMAYPIFYKHLELVPLKKERRLFSVLRVNDMKSPTHNKVHITNTDHFDGETALVECVEKFLFALDCQC